MELKMRTVKLWLIIIAALCNMKTIQGISLRLRSALISSGDWLNDIDGDNIPGQAGVDYPVHSSVPENTSFRCGRFEYAGYFADVEADCQAYHVCFPDGRNASFLCVNGTVFHQRYYVCDWWFHSNCSLAPDLYELNLYRKIPLPVLPPVRRRPFPGPAPQPQVQEPPKLREAKQMSVKPNIRKDSDKPQNKRKDSNKTENKRKGSDEPENRRRGNDKKLPRENYLPPTNFVEKKTLLSTRNNDTCICQCNNVAYHQVT